MKGNIIYLSHGGGPLPILGDKSHRAMLDFMQRLPEEIPKPESIIVVSAHWEEPVPTITGGEKPGLFYDYYGFPQEAYALKYPAAGNPELGKSIKKLLAKKGIESRLDHNRGFDHGAFIPLKLMYPQADIPLIQLSLVMGLDPVTHLEMGSALKDILAEKILLIGSGFSFHNMGAFDGSGRNTEDEKNDAFQDWLIDICSGTYEKEEREKQLQHWAHAPHASYCHPREEHLIPLHVCLGAAADRGRIIFDDYILGKRAIAVAW